MPQSLNFDVPWNMLQSYDQRTFVGQLPSGLRERPLSNWDWRRVSIARYSYTEMGTFPPSGEIDMGHVRRVVVSDRGGFFTRLSICILIDSSCAAQTSSLEGSLGYLTIRSSDILTS